FRPPFPVQPGQVGGGLGPEARNDKDRPADGRVVIGPRKDRDPNALAPGAGGKRPDDVAKQGLPPDPKVIWQDALVKGVENPSLIIAVADFLAQMQRWDHVAEFLKADLR